MLFPDFARAVESADPVAQRSMIGPVLLALALATVAAAIMSSAAPLIVDIVYARGAFDEVAAGMTSEFLRWHSIGLPFMVATIILAQATLAFRAYGLVLAVGLARILAKWLAVVWLVPSHGLGGLAASFIVPEVVSAVVLFVTLQWRLGRLRSGAAPR
jgi:putative peptidoglycan lipid II flippase